MADLDWPSDSDNEIALNEAPLQLSNSPFAFPQGSVFLPPDSNFLLETETKESKVNTPLRNINISPTEVNRTKFRGIRTLTRLTPSPPSPSPSNNSPLPSPPQSPGPWSSAPRPGPASLPDEEQHFLGIILYLEKQTRAGALHALVWRECSKDFFRIPIDDFPTPPRPATRVIFLGLATPSFPIGFKTRHPCWVGRAPEFLSEGVATPPPIRGVFSDSPFDSKKFFFSWCPISEDPSFSIKFS